jgi:hypothetical protein
VSALQKWTGRRFAAAAKRSCQKGRSQTCDSALQGGELAEAEQACRKELFLAWPPASGTESSGCGDTDYSAGHDRPEFPISPSKIPRPNPSRPGYPLSKHHGEIVHHNRLPPTRSCRKVPQVVEAKLRCRRGAAIAIGLERGRRAEALSLSAAIGHPPDASKTSTTSLGEHELSMALYARRSTLVDSLVLRSQETTQWQRSREGVAARRSQWEDLHARVESRLPPALATEQLTPSDRTLARRFPMSMPTNAPRPATFLERNVPTQLVRQLNPTLPKPELWERFLAQRAQTSRLSVG